MIHPSFAKEKDFERLDNFLKENGENVVCVEQMLEFVRKNQGWSGMLLERMIYAARWAKKHLG